MTELLILSKLQMMPEELKLEALHYFDYLILEHNKKMQLKGKPVFGSAKGKYNMQSDFDEPLTDFQEYME